MSTKPSFVVARLIENKIIARDCHTLIFNGDMCASPGQFVMIWIPGVDEIPMSISHQAENRIGITVKIVGEATQALASLTRGTRVRIRGPYGRPFEIKGQNPVLVAGGIGVAPLHLLACSMRGKRIRGTVIIGAKTEREISLKKDFEELGFETIVATDDGSAGYHGTASDCLRKELSQERGFDFVYCCGPEAMIKSILEISNKRGILGQAALERLMKCGIGICGACAINDKLICKDGPVFDFSQLKNLSEFGKCRRDSSGRTRVIG